ncbi:MAG: ATP-binding cassette domain-containing protein, partial [Solimonas sp.]
MEARHLHFGFADRVILRDLHLVLGRGEVVGLVGPNGAGKTTLLRLLAGEKSPSSGTVTRLGETLVGPTLRRRIGYLPDDAALFDELTGLENLLLFAGVRRKASSARADECRALAMALGLSELQLQERVATYSFGMRRKVAIGQS